MSSDKDSIREWKGELSPPTRDHSQWALIKIQYGNAPGSSLHMYIYAHAYLYMHVHACMHALQETPPWDPSFFVLWLQ